MKDIKTIYLSADHAGYELKESVKTYLLELKTSNGLSFEISDLGAYKYEPDDNYTDLMHKVGHELSAKLKSRAEVDSYMSKDIAFVFGGSGEGESMLMNRYEGVRAITYYGGDINIIRLGREHNNANCISFGARFVNINEAKQAVMLFLSTNFEGGRHMSRVRDIDKKKLSM